MTLRCHSRDDTFLSWRRHWQKKGRETKLQRRQRRKGRWRGWGCSCSCICFSHVPQDLTYRKRAKVTFGHCVQEAMRGAGGGGGWEATRVNMSVDDDVRALLAAIAQSGFVSSLVQTARKAELSTFCSFDLRKYRIVPMASKSSIIILLSAFHHHNDGCRQ